MHDTYIYEFFDGVMVDPGYQPPKRPIGVFLLFSNRCGSTYVAELLGSTGRINKPREWLNWPAVVRVAAKNEAYSFDATLGLMTADAVDGRWAVKIGTDQFRHLKETGLLDKHFSSVVVIWSQREDLLAQAASLYVAQRTRQWSSTMAAVVSEDSIEFDLKAFRAEMLWLESERANAETLLREYGWPATPIVYERVLENPQQALQSALDAIGIPDARIDLTMVEIEKQESEKKAAFAHMYREQLGDPAE